MKIVKSMIHYPVVVPHNHVYLFTGNNQMNCSGELIMGKCALEAKKRYEWLPKTLGDIIRKESLIEYNLLLVAHGGGIVGAFQTKYSWRGSSPESLVRRSVLELKRMADANPDMTFHLPLPADENGIMSRDIRICSVLPDNVLIYVS